MGEVIGAHVDEGIGAALLGCAEACRRVISR